MLETLERFLKFEKGKNGTNVRIEFYSWPGYFPDHGLHHLCKSGILSAAGIPAEGVFVATILAACPWYPVYGLYYLTIPLAWLPVWASMAFCLYHEWGRWASAGR